MKTWLVYKHTSMRSGKSYIGLTSRSMEVRWKEHVLASKDTGYHFHNAIQLYGSDNWEHEVLHSDIDTLEEAEVLEKYYIKKYGTFENGYNSTGGGACGGIPYSRVTEEEKTESLKQASNRNKLRYGTEAYLFYNPELDIKERLEVMELAAKYNLHQGYVRYVTQGKAKHCNGWFLWTGEDGDYVISPVYTFEHTEYGTVTATLDEMVKKYNVSKGNICSVAKGSRRHTKGWTLPGMSVTNTKKIVNHNAKTVQVIFVDGSIEEYPSVIATAEAFGVTESVVRDRCSGRVQSNQFKEYTFKYK